MDGRVDRTGPRLTTVLSVARALVATLEPAVAARALVDEFGWDVAFQALALLPGPAARATLGHAWQHLLTDPLARDLTGE